MPTLEEVKASLKHLDKNATFWGRRELETLPEILLPDEEVLDALTGLYSDRNAMVVATDRRVLFVDKGMMGGLKVEDFPYTKISSVKYERGLMMGSVTLYTSGNAAQIKHIIKSDVQRFADLIRSKLQIHDQHSTSADDEGLVSKLERLATLKTAGVLTEEEFSAAKAKLIGL